MPLSFIVSMFARTFGKYLRPATSIPARAMASQTKGKILTKETLNPAVIAVEYAVRGPIVIRAGDIEKELQAGAKKPFTQVYRANIGDAQAVGQKPITFLRQVLGLIQNPSGLEDPNIPSDAKDRARAIIKGCKGSAGSYTMSTGIEMFRKDVAAYITQRDGGIPADPESIFLCAGASEGIRTTLKLLLTDRTKGKPAGVMIPTPQYPLYSATVSEYSAYKIGYYLNEAKQWSLEVDELKRAIDEAKAHCTPRVICVINPGNPTGQVLTRENMENVIKFAYDEHLFIMADEVYQQNIYASDRKFHSFKSVLASMPAPYNTLELCSYHSCSKGWHGECGIRGGYCETFNMDPYVLAQLKKLLSAKLCPPVSGQTCMDLIVNPPKEGEPSYPKFKEERDTVLKSLHERAKIVADTFNSIEGITCNEVQGAMYAFPNIKLPPKAIEAANAKGQTPDTFYCFALLEETGICVIPGSGFGQREGSYHFRTTILPQPAEIKTMMDLFRPFHAKFIAKYS